MTLLERLPYQILVDIFSRLNKRDLGSASLASRRVSNIAQPLLYKDVCLVNRHRSPNPLHLFLRTLLTPGHGLASSVRDLTIKWDNAVKSQPERDITLFRSAQSRLRLADSQEFSGGVQVELLLHLLPQLHALCLLPPNMCDSFDRFMNSHDLQQSIPTLPIAFQSLREFRCHWGDTDYAVSIETLVILLRLPYIRSINIPTRACSEATSHSVDAAIVAAAGTSTVTHLEFSRRQLPPSSLAGILRIPRALTHFSHYAERSDIATFELAEFGTMLEPLRRSLKALNLDIWDISPTAAAAARHQPVTAIGSLRDWPVLRTVKCPLLVLLGRQKNAMHRLADVLPAGLRELEILGDCYWPFKDAVHEVMVLLAQKERVLPRLQIVTVYGGYSRNLVEKLRASCLKAGVKLVAYTCSM